MKTEVWLLFFWLILSCIEQVKTSFTFKKNGMENELKITVVKNGPLKVEGELKLIMPNGEEKVQKNAFLCRCGGSSNKPFCDGTHRKIGFEAE